MLAADKDFNGRWDITAMTKPRPRAWWLELNGMGSPNPSGKFVSAYACDMNTIDTISVEKGVLRFTFHRPNRGQKTAQAAELVYTARLEGGKLEGYFEVEGQKNPPIQWT